MGSTFCGSDCCYFYTIHCPLVVIQTHFRSGVTCQWNVCGSHIPSLFLEAADERLCFSEQSQTGTIFPGKHWSVPCLVKVGPCTTTWHVVGALKPVLTAPTTASLARNTLQSHLTATTLPNTVQYALYSPLQLHSAVCTVQPLQLHTVQYALCSHLQLHTVQYALYSPLQLHTVQYALYSPLQLHTVQHAPIQPPAARHNAVCPVQPPAATHSAVCTVQPPAARHSAVCPVQPPAARHSAVCPVQPPAAPHSAVCTKQPPAAPHSAVCPVQPPAAPHSAVCPV